MERLFNSFFIILLLSCGHKQDEKKKSGSFQETAPVKEIINLEIKNDSLIQVWKKDSLGCLRLRTIKMAFTIAEKYVLKNKNQQEIINFLGTPNKIIKDGESTILRYHCHFCCNGTIGEKECDYSWVDIIFSPHFTSTVITSGVI